MTPSPVASRIRSIEAAAVAGLVFAVLSFISLLLLTSPPDPAAPDSEIITWYSDPANRALLTLGLSLSVVSAISFLWFVAVIRRRVGDREDRFFSTVFLGSGILLTGVMLVGSATLASGAVTADLADGRVPDASVLTALNGLGTSLLLLVLLRIQAVFVVSTSTLALRSNAFSRWLSYLGYGIALVMFFIPILTEPIGLAFPVWVGILSIALLIRKSDIVPEHDRP
jgi:multidrug transporter EmrE-like cation transporter